MIFDSLKALFSGSFGGSARRREAQELYIALVEQSRNPFLYSQCKVPDTLDGRFDLILLNLFLFLRQPHGPADKGMRRLLLESLFDDMDRNLREMGVGDMGVSRRVQAMSKAAFGRLTVYSDAEGDEAAFRTALIRNIYRNTENLEPDPQAVDVLLGYIREWKQPE